ncbi:MAG TPA: bifunctional diaminohydroxyphosphoribosylaminopyrimidine deaminase/5-amino-6-(5-phosphoribosylamino)uracil reductase RibD [Candidatus Polarisedimenticolaceae bacterium]|nr:bifunctional diaminohydroxyphosphoribosylaminopyrimidine deaminase/5-amino-6-(5-phosphoribosylamino)uracil reductase RibD [Candidatus Polarisedimenticolaceae bacterium]
MTDTRWMEQALALAALAQGTTAPNPRVGCLLVRDGEVVGRGWHRAAGLPHAEAMALAEAGDRAAGATLYVNLEPCAHQGRTPPCASGLVAAGVRRVVAAVGDPDPRVDGRGFAELRRAGIAVEVGLLAGEAERLNAGFLRRHRAGRPTVTLKAALSLDGMLSGLAGRSRWITGEAARRFAHRLRVGHDAVLVGAETVRRDDPRLTARLQGAPRQPLPVVLAPELRLPPDAALFAGPVRPRVYVREGAVAGREWEGRADLVRLPDREGRLDPADVLADLHGHGVQSVLVEGGGRTFAGFLAGGLVDEVALLVAPVLLGARGGTPFLDLAAAAEPALGRRVADVRRLALDEDVLLLGSVACSPG